MSASLQFASDVGGAKVRPLQYRAHKFRNRHETARQGMTGTQDQVSSKSEEPGYNPSAENSRYSLRVVVC